NLSFHGQAPFEPNLAPLVNTMMTVATTADDKRIHTVMTFASYDAGDAQILLDSSSGRRSPGAAAERRLRSGAPRLQGRRAGKHDCSVRRRRSRGQRLHGTRRSRDEGW